MEVSALQQVKQRYHIIGNSDGLNRALDIAMQVAQTDLSVLIIGESGVGKEAIPRLIHDQSVRKHNKYFAINCGSIPEGTIDSELFGHGKGAFTGSVGEREGYFGAASGGTLFLDEVGELPLSTQARLLRVLETGEYIRVGENEVRHTDVRIVAATNVNMQKAIRERRFREDLYYRLNTIPITLPPLRERGMDVELLFRYFAHETAKKYNIDPVRLTLDGRERILKHKWPGNIRQLRNLTEQLTVISEERNISADVLTQFGITDDSNNFELVTSDQDSAYHHSSSDNQRIADLEKQVAFLTQFVVQLSTEVKNLQKHFGGAHKPIKELEAHTSIIPGQAGYRIDHPDKIDDYQYDQAIPIEDEPPIDKRESERQNIIRALKQTHGNRKQAANLLGIADRTLYRKIKEYDLGDVY